jgi:hypothetical protein
VAVVAYHEGEVASVDSVYEDEGHSFMALSGTRIGYQIRALREKL